MIPILRDQEAPVAAYVKSQTLYLIITRKEYHAMGSCFPKMNKNNNNNNNNKNNPKN